MNILGVIDRRLMAVSAPVRAVVILVTLAVMTYTVLPKIPRPFLDLSRWPALAGVTQPDSFGTDTIADAYEARVVRNDVRDMYTKSKVEQTPLEAATWTKEASSPYPPATLLALAALAASGDALGIGLYGMVAGLAVLFLALSLVYFLRTRWYLFPLLYLNFAYLAERFFFVQDASYLVMLVVVMAALLVARRAPIASQALMAVAIVMKLSPLYYIRHFRTMPRAAAVLFGTILVAGLIAPYFLWDNYLSIFIYNNDLKGSAWSGIGALAGAAFLAGVLSSVESRRRWDLEDLIGWSLVPMALFFAIKMNVARHLLLVLLVPDTRGLRNVAAAVGLGLHALLPAVIVLNSTLPIVGAILVWGLLTGTGSSDDPVSASQARSRMPAHGDAP